MAKAISSGTSLVPVTAYNPSKMGAQLNKVSLALSAASKGFEKKLHEHMVNIVVHFTKCGDATAASFLFNSLPTSVRRDAIATWFTAFGGMNFGKDDNGLAKFTRNKSVPFEQIDIQLARETNPWEYAKEPKIKPFDLLAALDSVLKRAKKAESGEMPAPEGKPHVIPADKLAALELLLK